MTGMSGRGIKGLRSILGLGLLLATAAVTAGSGTALTWTWNNLMTTGPALTLDDLSFGNGVYVAVGDDTTPAAEILESPDGTNWSTVYSGASNTFLQHVVYGNGVFVATDEHTTWLSSTDGVTWSPIAIPPAHGNVPLFANGLFTIFGSDCGCMETSSDGQTWTSQATSRPTLTNIVSTGTEFVGLNVASSGAAVAFQSKDGVTWTKTGEFKATAGTYFNILRSSGNGFIAAGYAPYGESCVGVYCNPNIIPAVATSADGVNWNYTILNSGDLSDGTFADASYDGHLYLAVFWSDNPNAMAVSADGASWCKLAGFPTMPVLTAVIQIGSQTFITGTSGQIVSAATSSSETFGCLDAPSSYVPPNSGGGGGGGSGGGGGGGYGSGGVDVLTLLGLLGLAALRRRIAGLN
ncbi:MAG: hypothetical protein ACM3ZT_04345 [Bacillota bacterium]